MRSSSIRVGSSIGRNIHQNNVEEERAREARGRCASKDCVGALTVRQTCLDERCVLLRMLPVHAPFVHARPPSGGGSLPRSQRHLAQCAKSRGSTKLQETGAVLEDTVAMGSRGHTAVVIVRLSRLSVSLSCVLTSCQWGAIAHPAILHPAVAAAGERRPASRVPESESASAVGQATQQGTRTRGWRTSAGDGTAPHSI
jgi:hypothetical protein